MNFSKFFALFLLLGMALSGFVSAAHYIVGYVNDARDGTDSENHTIMLWNPSVGTSDNLIGSIGEDGAAGQEAMYMLDCELLSNGCSVGDNLSLKVVDNGDGYITEAINVTVTGAGYDFVDNLTLNSPPNVTLNSPGDAIYVNNASFNCTFFDWDGPSGFLKLWGNFTGSWEEEDSYEVSSGNLTHVFIPNIGEGYYFWTCSAEDNLSVETFVENRTVGVDFTSPIIHSILVNESSICGYAYVKVTCNVTDNFSGVDKVILEINNSRLWNETMDYSGNDLYTKEVYVNESGGWKFKCYAFDNASNMNYSDHADLTAYSGYPELYVNGSKISFSDYSPVENEEVNVSAVIENRGCVDASLFNVSFFKQSISWLNQLGNNQSIIISAFSSKVVNMTYSAFIGLNNIWVFADSGEEINEENESDNKANNSISVTLWQKFYGNVSAEKVLRTDENFSTWSNFDEVAGNIFVVDKEADVNWLELEPFSRNETGAEEINDFSELDDLLNTSGYEDSISKTYLDGGQVRETSSFVVHNRNITNVPVVNSTNNSDFVTGILWDGSDDGGDGQFSEGDKEDVIFVTKLRNGVQGAYGVYDYEVRVPVKLRDYDTTDTSEVYFYYDLI